MNARVASTLKRLKAQDRLGVTPLDEMEQGFLDAIEIGQNDPQLASEQLRQLAEKFDLSAVALTRGAAGTMLLTPEGEVEGVVERVEPVADADSVGTGDACCAGLITGLLLNWSAEDTLHLANQAGAFVAAQAGATPPLPASLQKWLHDTRHKYQYRGSEVSGS